MGLNCKVGHAYLYGPICYQGTIFPNLFTELCIERIKLLLKHGGRPTQIGISLEACLEGHQLEIGNNVRFFDANFDKHGFLISNSVLLHTWKILCTDGLHLDTTHNLPELCCEGDSFIMKKIWKRQVIARSN